MGGGYFLSAALILTSQSDVLVIGWLGGAEAAARYVLLWKIAEVGVTALWRISESWSPILVRLDAMNEHAAIKRQYWHVVALLLATAIPAGLAYALLGPWVTTLWLGAEHAPKDQFGFVLAGAAIVWMGLARLPSILSYSLARFRLWTGIASCRSGGAAGIDGGALSALRISGAARRAQCRAFVRYCRRLSMGRMAAAYEASMMSFSSSLFDSNCHWIDFYNVKGGCP